MSGSSTSAGAAAPISQADRAQRVEVTAADLPLHCPTPGAPLWARHPRVFLDVAKKGEARCPYCGTQFVLKGPAGSSH